MDLLQQQAYTQRNKRRSRQLTQYGQQIFMVSDYRPCRSPVSEFLGQFANADNVRLDIMLEGMQEDHERPIHWADMGCGYAVAQRQAIVHPRLMGKVVTTGVDLFPLEVQDLPLEDQQALEQVSPGACSTEAGPYFIQGDIQTVALPGTADLITSVESISYLDNPLQAISNWYNQLTDDGILVVATEAGCSWTDSITYENHYTAHGEKLPMDHVVRELSYNGIAYALAKEADSFYGIRPLAEPSNASCLVIQKAPNTRMESVAEVAEVRVSCVGFKGIRYAQLPEGVPPIQVSQW